MSEEEKKADAPDLDGALQTLLGDLAKQDAVNPAPAPIMDIEAKPITESPPTPESTPSGETTVADEDLPGAPEMTSDEMVEPVEESAVIYGTVPRGRLRPGGAYRPRRKWPWILLMLVCFVGSLAIWSRHRWLPRVEARFSHASVKKVESPAELPPTLTLPAMDEPFLPPGSDTNGASSPDSGHAGVGVEPVQGPKPEPEKKVELPVPDPHKTAAPPPKPTGEHPIVAKQEPIQEKTPKAVSQPAPKIEPLPVARPVENQAPRAMDSAVIHNIEGKMAGERVQFHGNLALYSSTGDLARKLPPFEEAIRAVTGNIFYFTVPGKAKIPEIELQILQKAGFLFPDGKLIRVELRDLELEEAPP